MKQIITKYDGTCTSCGAELDAEQPAWYERGMGIFCMGCEPTDPEQVRALRQAAADRKAARLEGWADGRRRKAAELERRNDPFRKCHAFNTQPGRIPERDRCNARSARAHEHTAKAQRMEQRAARLRRGVRVAGDAERKRAAYTEHVRGILKEQGVGAVVESPFFGTGKVVKLNRKTARVQWGRGFENLTELFLLKPTGVQ